MECYCDPIEPDEVCQVYEVTWRRARKAHVCCECGEAIETGQRYEYTFTVLDGEVTVYKTCGFCANEFTRLRDKHPGVEFCKTDLACILVWDMRRDEGRA